MAHDENIGPTPVLDTSDPTHRIDKLPSATQGIISVKPDSNIQEIITLMLLHDFSQLPVMQSSRNVKGIVSWKSIGIRFNLGIDIKTANDCMDDPVFVRMETPILDAIDQIIQHDYVLVRNHENIITGIVTTSDIGIQFLRLGRPFLLLEEIEYQIRWIIDGKFTIEELLTAVDKTDEREIKGVSDLTFGEYIRLLENPDHWKKIELPIDRKTFKEHLDMIRNIRNKVMHFNPAGLGREDIDLLHASAKFFQLLRKVQKPRK